MIMAIKILLFLVIFVIHILTTSSDGNSDEIVKLSDVMLPVKLENYTRPFLDEVVSIQDQIKTAVENYPKFIECIKNSPHGRGFDFSKLKLPADAEEHYRDLLNQTAIFRQAYTHTHSDYGGPWIENFFIYNFEHKPLSYFSGLIPLFIQWTDIHVHDFSWMKAEGVYKGPYIPEWKHLAELISPLLRKDVIYVTVIQDDEGIRKKLAEMNPNILSISAGGFGHIAIPLIKGELMYMPPTAKFSYDVGFYGAINRVIRGSMTNSLRRHGSQNALEVKIGESANWLKDMMVTKFNLAPRGFGRTSFRLSEIIQLGRLPVYIYDDLPWVPYGESNISIKSFGFVERANDLESLCKRVKEMNEEDVQRRLKYVRDVREEYTYRGVIRQIDKFFNDPFGPNGGNLVCTRVPSSEKR